MTTKQRPEGLCTQLYQCRKCGGVMYQRPGVDVTHPCPKTNRHETMKEITDALT